MSGAFFASCSVLDPTPILAAAPAPSMPQPLARLATSIGSLLLLAQLGAAGANVVNELEAEEAARVAAGAPTDRFLWSLVAGGAMTVLALIATWVAGSLMESEIREMTQSVEVEKADTASSAETRNLLMKYRDLKARRVVWDARFEYLGRVMCNRVAWPRFFNALDHALAAGTCTISSVDVDTRFPGSPRGPLTDDPSKVVSFTLRGESRSLAGVTQLLQALKKARGIRSPKVLNSRLVRPATDPTGGVFAFEIAGEINGQPQDR